MDVPPEQTGEFNQLGDDADPGGAGSNGDDGVSPPYDGPDPGGEDPYDLIQQVQDSDGKITPDNVVGITRTPDGKIVWLETGNSRAGLEHIMDGDGTSDDKGHRQDFANIGVDGDENVTELIIDTLQEDTPIGTTDTGAEVFAVTINGVVRQIAIVMGSNGFVVSAYPYKGK